MAYGTKQSYNLYFRQIATFYHLPSMESTKSFKKQSVLFNSRARYLSLNLVIQEIAISWIKMGTFMDYMISLKLNLNS